MDPVLIRHGRALRVLALLLTLVLLPVPRALASASDDRTDAGAAEELGTRDPYDPDNLPRKVRKIVFLASAYAKRGNMEKAARLLEEHLRDHPDQDHYLLRLHLAQHLSDLGEPEEALDQYRAAVRLHNELDRAWFGLGDAAYDLERFEVAGEAFLHGYECSRDRPAEVLYYAAASYLRADEPAAALPLFERLVTERGAEATFKWYQGLVVAAQAVDEPARADAGLEQLLRREADNPEAWYLEYQHEVGRRDFDAAAVALTVVGYLRDLTPQEQRQLGDLHSVSGVPWLASRSYEAAMGPDASAVDYERLASALVAAHEPDAALGVLGEALMEFETPRLVSLLADIHYMQRDFDDAAVAYARLGRMGDDVGRAELMLGYCALEQGDKEKALTHLGRASTDPEHADMAQLLMQRAMRL